MFCNFAQSPKRNKNSCFIDIFLACFILFLIFIPSEASLTQDNAVIAVDVDADEIQHSKVDFSSDLPTFEPEYEYKEVLPGQHIPPVSCCINFSDT